MIPRQPCSSRCLVHIILDTYHSTLAIKLFFSLQVQVNYRLSLGIEQNCGAFVASAMRTRVSSAKPDNVNGEELVKPLGLEVPRSFIIFSTPHKYLQKRM